MYRAQTRCNLTRRTLGVKPPSAFLDDGTPLSLNPGKMKSQGKKMIRNQFKNTHKGKQELSNKSCKKKEARTANSVFTTNCYFVFFDWILLPYKTRLLRFASARRHNMLVVVWRATRFATKWDWVFTWCLPKGNFPCYKMRLGFYMLSSDRQIPLLQNDFRFLKVFQLPKRWKCIKCNSQALGTKCRAHPHFFILF